MKHVRDGQQSLVFLGELSGQHGTEGESLAGVGIMGDGDEVGIRVVTDGMDARHLTAANVIDTQILLVRRVLFPSLLAVDVPQSPQPA